MNKKTVSIMIAIVLIVGVLSFYGGMKYTSAKVPMRNQAFAGLGAGQFRNGQGGNRGMMGAVIGQIISKDDKSITVKLNEGGSKIVFLSESTVISKNDTATMADLAVGSQVVVGGTPSQDGSVTAQFIQLGTDLRSRQFGRPSTAQ